MSNDSFHMDGHKLFWHLDRVSDWQSGELIAPVYVEISPVSFCNHNCIFCGLDFAHGEKLSLDADILKQRLEEMGRLGVRSIMFAGEGEPLLHKDLPGLAATAKDAGIDVSITTNGSAGHAKLWEELLPSLSWVRFSIDAGSPEVHSLVHRVPESQFERTLQSISEALAVRERCGHNVTIGVQYLLLPENIDDIADAVQLYDHIGVDYISFKPYSEHPQMLGKTGFSYTVEMLDRIDSVIEACRLSSRTRLIFRSASAAGYGNGEILFNACRALPFWGYISSGGDFYTCSVFLNDDRFKVGNIYSESMESIFFGEKRRQSVEFGCRGLVVGEECRLNCRMARINEFLDFLDRKPEHINFI